MLVDTHASKMTKPRVQAIPLREAAKLQRKLQIFLRTL